VARTAGSMSRAWMGVLLGAVTTALFGLLPWGVLPWLVASLLSGVVLLRVSGSTRSLLAGWVVGMLAYYLLISYLSKPFHDFP